MNRPIVYIGFGGGDLANYWPVDYTPPAINAIGMYGNGDLTPQFRYGSMGRSLNYEVASAGAPATGRIMSSLAHNGGLAGMGGIAGIGGGLAG